LLHDLADAHGAHALEHFRNAANLVRIVTARQDVMGPGKADGKFDGPWIEVDGVVIKLFQICAGRLWDVGATFAECFEAAIEPLNQIGNCAAEVAEDPTNIWET